MTIDSMLARIWQKSGWTSNVIR